jgi:predicted AlkP superfamily phosphohydrolase/phosphomutase
MRIRRLPRKYSKIKDFLIATHVLGMNDVIKKTQFGKTRWWGKIQGILREPVYETDWSQTRVFSFSRGSDGFVFLLDVDPSGKNVLERELKERLLGLRNPTTRQPILHQVLRKEDVYQGSFLESMPDLILKPMPGYSVTGDFNPFFDDLLMPIRKSRDFHIGMHHPDGIFVAAGDLIKPNSRITGVRLIDIAPTILALLGLDIPDTMDGRVVQDLFIRRLSTKGSSREGATQSLTESHSDIYSQKDIHSIEERLRSLGYME